MRAIRVVMYPEPAPTSATTIPGRNPMSPNACSGASSCWRAARSSQLASVAMPAI